jgi:hypothetical protein
MTAAATALHNRRTEDASLIGTAAEIHHKHGTYACAANIQRA